MRFVFVPPGTGLSNAMTGHHAPVGVLLLAAVLREHGHEAGLFHQPLYFPSRVHSAGAAALLLQDQPDVVGFSAWCHTLPAQLSLARELKRQRPDLPIVFGGPQATAIGAELLRRWDFVDLVLRGEAEDSLPVLLDALGGDLHGVPGLSWRDGADVVDNAPAPPVDDLDALPRPAHELGPPSPFAAVEPGRGCVYSCRFCSTSSFFSRKHRRRSPRSLVDEMEWLARERGVTHFTFTDDLFTVNKAHVRAICDELRARELQVSWGCDTRIDRVDPPLLREMAAAGCTGILYGVESASPRMQRLIGKRLDLDRLVPTVQATIDAGIRPYCSFILGFPDEQPDDLQLTLDTMRRLVALGVAVHAQTLAVLPDTGCFHDAGDDWLYDGFTSLSRAALSPAEAAEVRALPHIFSSFHYRPSPAASREFLVGAMHLGNLLRHFRHTAPLLQGDPFAVLRQALPTIPGDTLRHDFDATGIAIIGRVAATTGPAARAVFELERAVLLAGRQPARHGLQPGWFLHRTPAPIASLLAGSVEGEPACWLVQLTGDDAFRLLPLTCEEHDLIATGDDLHAAGHHDLAYRLQGVGAR